MKSDRRPKRPEHARCIGSQSENNAVYWFKIRVYMRLTLCLLKLVFATRWKFFVLQESSSVERLHMLYSFVMFYNHVKASSCLKRRNSIDDAVM